MNAELDVARVGRAGVEAVAPLEPRLALRASAAGLVADHRRLEDATGRLRGLDADAPFARAATGFLVSDEGVIAIKDRIVSVHVGEGFVGGAAVGNGSL